jgi:hypothetical protein
MENENGDLISRSALIKTIREDAWAYRVDWDFEGISGYIYTQEAVDAVKVVRCKDCEYWEKQDWKAANNADEPLAFGGCCHVHKFGAIETDYCSKGRRKNDE